MIDVLVVPLFLLLMVVCAIAALRVKDLLAAVTIFGAFSFFSAAFFVVQDALDVGEEHEAVRTERGRDLTRGGIGVDVEQRRPTHRRLREAD